MQTIDSLRRRALLLTTAGGLVASLAACNSALPLPTATLGTAVTTVIATRTLSLEAGAWEAFPVTLPASGTLRVSLEWGDAANDVRLLVMGSNCRSLSSLEDCPIRRTGVRQGKQSEAVYPEVSGRHTVWVGNLGPGAETVSATVELTYQPIEPVRDLPSPDPEPERKHPRDPRDK